MKPKFKHLTKFSLLFAAAFVTACAPKAKQALPDDTIQESPVSENLVASSQITKEDQAPAETKNDSSPQIQSPFAHIDPTGIVPKPLLATALKYFVTHRNEIQNKNVISVIDYSKPSNRRRFYIIDMHSGKVWAIPVAHGRGSDANQDGVAERFSNSPSSHASSLGVFKTAETYQGAHGLSLRLDGLSSSNSNARSRAIVVHGADYVQERDVIQGRSWGCPAVPQADRTRVIGLLKGGSILYAGRSY
jgi:hypothetical protein